MKQEKTVRLLQFRKKRAAFGHPGSWINKRTWKTDGGGPREATTSLRREHKTPEFASCLHPKDCQLCNGTHHSVQPPSAEATAFQQNAALPEHPEVQRWGDCTPLQHPV